MPKNCAYCPLSEYRNSSILDCKQIGTVGTASRDNNVLKRRHPNCPLIEIPTPHGRLGDLDKLMTEFMDSDLDHLQRDDWKEVIQIVSDADVVIEAEGRE